jgi:O-antigen ligase
MNSINYYFKLDYLAIIIFSFFPILPNNIKGLPVVLLFLVTLYLYFTKKNKKIKYPIKKVLQFTSIYLILLISLIFSDNFTHVDKQLSTRLSLLIVPISVGFLYSSGRKISLRFFLRFIKILLYVSTIFSFWILLLLFQLGVFSNSMSLYDAIAYITNEMWVISQHPIYASIFIAISILLTIYLWFVIKKRHVILYTSPLVLLNLFTLLMLERRGVLLSFILSLIIIIFSFIKTKVLNKSLKIFAVLSLIIGFIFIISSNRFQELYQKKNYTNVIEFNSTSLRYGIYYCALEKIKKSPLVGYGIGDVQIELNKCYDNRSKFLTELTYNSHNQYLSYFLSSGIFGFLLLLFLLLRTAVDAIKNKNTLLLSITVFFAINMLFENILERQSGVVLFSFYICLFSFYNFSNMRKV